MKRSFLDFFSREFEIKLSVSSRDVITKDTDQLSGVAILAKEGNAVFRANDTANIEETFAQLRELAPRVARIDAESPDCGAWLKFCQEEEINPHLVFSAEMEPERMIAFIHRVMEQFAPNDLWEPRRFYEIACDFSDMSFAEDSAVIEAINQLKEKAAEIRSIDPDAKVILGGIAPIGDKRGKAEIWNPALIRTCAETMDMVGIRLVPTVLSGRSWDEDEDGIEADYALAEEVRAAIQRLERQIREAAPDSGIQIAVTGWSFLSDGLPQKRQDCVYYTSVYENLRKASGLVALNEYGPLFGKEGLLQYEKGNVYGNIFYHNMLVASPDLPICLDIKEVDYEKPGPVSHWQGVPGTFEGKEIQLLDAYASRSKDGKRLFLLLTNRSAFKKAVPRVRFYDFKEMHPIEALVLKSKKRLDENTADHIEAVFCKEVQLRKYRDMDHVTLEIPECSTVCMVLE